MSKSPGGISFEELEGSPEIHGDDDGVRATRRFKIFWADWPSFVGELMGQYAIQYNGATVPFWVPANPPNPSSVVVYSPAQVAFPGFPNAFVSGFKVQPFQPESPDSRDDNSPKPVDFGNQTNTYDLNDGGAIVTAEYETLFDVSSDDRQWGTGTGGTISPPVGTFLTYGGNASGEVLTTPGRTFYWQGSAPQEPLSADMSPGIVIPGNEHTITWRRVIAPPWNTINSMIGKVNASTFLGAPAGSVMFLGCQPKRIPRYQLSGTLFNLEYKFAQQSKFLSDGSIVGWNYLYKPTQVNGEHWVQILTTDTNSPPHATADFSLLFQYGN